MAILTKPKANGALARLEETQKAELADLLMGGLSYERAPAVIAERWGIKTSPAAVGRFWRQDAVQFRLLRRRKAASMAEEVAREAVRDPGQFDAAMMDSLKQKAFELAQSDAASVEDVRSLVGLVLKIKDQEQAQQKIGIDLRKLAVLEEKERRAAQAKELLGQVTNKGGLTQETLRAIEEAAGLL